MRAHELITRQLFVSNLVRFGVAIAIVAGAAAVLIGLATGNVDMQYWMAAVPNLVLLLTPGGVLSAVAMTALAAADRASLVWNAAACSLLTATPAVFLAQYALSRFDFGPHSVPVDITPFVVIVGAVAALVGATFSVIARFSTQTTRRRL